MILFVLRLTFILSGVTILAICCFIDPNGAVAFLAVVMAVAGVLMVAVERKRVR